MLKKECMKIKIFVFLMATFFIVGSAQAEIITCTGRTNDPNTTAMNFELEVEGKPDRYGFGLVFYNAVIAYKTPSGSILKQGFDVDGKVRKRLKKISYTGSNQSNYLELNFSSDDSLESAFLNHSLAGFDRLPVNCEVYGDLPVRPVCTENIDKQKPLLQAIRNSNDLDLIETTIECGAEVNKVDKNGCSPLMLALDEVCGQENPTRFGSTVGGVSAQIVDLLVSNGAFVGLADKYGETALIKAARANFSDVYSTFIAAEADFDAQDNLGNTALMYAAYNGDDWVVQQILEGNPDRRIKNKKGQTAFDIAKHWQRNSVLDLVRIPDLEIMVEGKDDGTCSPLQMNFKRGQVVEMTLKATKKMFKLDSKKLGVDLMADGNGSARKIFVAEKKGIFPFTCGYHGANQSSQGSITID